MGLENAAAARPAARARAGAGAATGRPRGKRTGARAGGCSCGLPGLEDYSSRHAPRASLPASEPRRAAGPPGAGGASLGQQEWGPFPPSVGVCQQNRWMFGLGEPQNPQATVSTPKETETAPERGSAFRGSCSGAGREGLAPRTVLFPAAG